MGVSDRGERKKEKRKKDNNKIIYNTPYFCNLGTMV
jgi:hypothetical protein